MTNTTFISQNLTGWHALTLYFLLSTTISSRLTVVSGFFALAINQFREKKAEYECGFEPFDSATRLPFEVHFYLVGILFLVFDVEVLVSLPWVVAQHFIDWFGFFSREFFICLLTVGFIFEWQRGALVWPSRAKEEPFENSIPFVEIVVIFIVAYTFFIARFAYTQLQSTDTKIPGDKKPGDIKLPGAKTPGDIKIPGDKKPGDIKLPGAKTPGDIKLPGAKTPGGIKLPGATTIPGESWIATSLFRITQFVVLVGCLLRQLDYFKTFAYPTTIHSFRKIVDVATTLGQHIGYFLLAWVSASIVRKQVMAWGSPRFRTNLTFGLRVFRAPFIYRAVSDLLTWLSRFSTSEIFAFFTNSPIEVLVAHRSNTVTFHWWAGAISLFQVLVACAAALVFEKLRDFIFWHFRGPEDPKSRKIVFFMDPTGIICISFADNGFTLFFFTVGLFIINHLVNSTDVDKPKDDLPPPTEEKPPEPLEPPVIPPKLPDVEGYTWVWDPKTGKWVLVGGPTEEKPPEPLEPPVIPPKPPEPLEPPVIPPKPPDVHGYDWIWDPITKTWVLYEAFYGGWLRSPAPIFRYPRRGAPKGGKVAFSIGIPEGSCFIAYCVLFVIFLFIMFAVCYKHINTYNDCLREGIAAATAAEKDCNRKMGVVTSFVGRAFRSCWLFECFAFAFMRKFVYICLKRFTKLSDAQIKRFSTVFWRVSLLLAAICSACHGSVFNLLLPTITLSSTLGVLLFRNPVYALLALILVFFNTVVVLVSAQAEFLGLSFLVVYVGAISILFLFVIRLLNIQELRSARADTKVYTLGDEVLLVSPICLIGTPGGITIDMISREVVERSAAILKLAEASVAALRHYVSWRFTDIMMLSSLLYSYFVALFLRITVVLLTARLGGIILATKK